MRPFEPAWIGRVELPNRLVRSATFEGLCDAAGCPGPAYAEFYADLAAQGLGALITGFAFTSRDGRAMQPGQAGLDSDSQIAPFRQVTQAVHRRGGRIFVQLAHAGRQTIPAVTGGRVYGPSTRRSSYFRQCSERLTEPHLERIIAEFAAAARRAQAAEFDGVQLHAAHGYLLHQFLHPAVNDRTDAYGPDPRTGIGTALLGGVIDRVRAECGLDFVSLSRPLLCEPDFALRIRAQPDYVSRCRNCNRCAVRCDAGVPTRCYARAPLEKELTHEPRR